MPLTDTAIKKIKPGTKPMKLSDGKGLYLLVNNLVGVALGPLLAGVLSDHFSLQRAMQVFSWVPFFSAGAYFMAARCYEPAGMRQAGA